MGQYGNIEVQVSLEKEDINKAVEIIDNFEREIKEHIQKGEPFSATTPNITHDDECGFLELNISSDRVQNAEWQTRCLVKLLQIHKIGVTDFNAEVTVPQTFIYINDEDDFEDFDCEL